MTLRKREFGKFRTATNTSPEERGNMIWGMGPQYVGDITGHGRQNKNAGTKHKKKRKIAQASRRRNRGSI